MRTPISNEVRQNVQQAFNNRCVYCQSAQQYVLGVLEIDHIIPLSAGGTTEEDNLCLSCRLCNGYKASQTSAIDPISQDSVPLFNPRTQTWDTHFEWDDSGIQINGITECGRATVTALKLNNKIALMVRQNWVKAGWHPPDT